MCQNGPESMLADATLAAAEEPPWSPRRPMVLWLLGEAHLVLGDVDEARDLFDEASTSMHTGWAPATPSSSRKPSSRCWHLIAATRTVPVSTVRVGRGVIEAAGLEDYSSALLVYAAAARLAVSRGDVSEARRELGQAMRRRPAATYVPPIIAVRLRLQLAAVYLALGEPTTAQHLLREVDDILQRRPALGTLVEETEKLRARASAAPAAGLSRVAPHPCRAARASLPADPSHIRADRCNVSSFRATRWPPTSTRSTASSPCRRETTPYNARPRPACWAASDRSRLGSRFERLVRVVADRQGELRCLGHGSGKPDDGNDLDQHVHDLGDGRTHIDRRHRPAPSRTGRAPPTPTSAARRTSASVLASSSDGPRSEHARMVLDEGRVIERQESQLLRIVHVLLSPPHR